MKTRPLMTLAAAIITFQVMTACDSGIESVVVTPEACKQAMAEQLDREIAADLNDEEVPDTYDRPLECAGLDDAAVQAIAEQVIAEAVQRTINGGTP